MCRRRDGFFDSVVRQIMRRLVFTSLLAGVAFGVGMSVLFVPLFYLAGQIQNGINLSAVTGALFGLAIGWFSYSTEKKFRTRGVHLHPGETLVHQGPANHFVGRESVGGWLCITNQRLFFESHKLNNFLISDQAQQAHPVSQ